MGQGWHLYPSTPHSPQAHNISSRVYVEKLAMLYKTSDNHAIYKLTQSCMQSFTRLLDLLRETESGSVIESEEQRFIVWAKNAGAHRKYNVSLDYRLREAFEVKEMVLKLLDDLENELQDSKRTISLTVYPASMNGELISTSGYNCFGCDSAPRLQHSVFELTLSFIGRRVFGQTGTDTHRVRRMRF